MMAAERRMPAESRCLSYRDIRFAWTIAAP